MELGFILLAGCVLFLGMSYGDIKNELSRIQDIKNELDEIKLTQYNHSQVDMSVQRRLKTLNEDMITVKTKLVDFNTVIKEIRSDAMKEQPK